MKFCIGGIALLTALFSVAEPKIAATAAREALDMCLSVLIPSLFPFFVSANVMLRSGMISAAGKRLESVSRGLFGIGRGGAAAIPLGFISGYPAGAIVAARLYEAGSISKTEGERLMAFTNNPGPMFILGVIGEGVYGRREVGWILLISVMAASVICGICIRKKDNEKQMTVPKNTVSDPMGQAVMASLRLSGFVIFFSVVSAFLRHLGLIPLIGRVMVQMGMGENTAEMISAGILEVSVLSKYRGALPAMAGLLSFGGISVFLQVWDTARRAGLSVKYYIAGKFLASGLAACFCFLLLKLVPVAVETAKITGETGVEGMRYGAAFLPSLGICGIYFLVLRKKRKTALPTCVKM